MITPCEGLARSVVRLCPTDGHAFLDAAKCGEASVCEVSFDGWRGEWIPVCPQHLSESTMFLGGGRRRPLTTEPRPHLYWDR